MGVTQPFPRDRRDLGVGPLGGGGTNSVMLAVSRGELNIVSYDVYTVVTLMMYFLCLDFTIQCHFLY